MLLQPINDSDDIKKHATTGAILFVDNRALEAYKKKKQHQFVIVNDINNIKAELKEIRDMLQIILAHSAKIETKGN